MTRKTLSPEILPLTTPAGGRSPRERSRARLGTLMSTSAVTTVGTVMYACGDPPPSPPASCSTATTEQREQWSEMSIDGEWGATQTISTRIRVGGGVFEDVRITPGAVEGAEVQSEYLRGSQWELALVPNAGVTRVDLTGTFSCADGDAIPFSVSLTFDPDDHDTPITVTSS